MSWLLLLPLCQIRFTETAQDVGLRFQHFAHQSKGLHLPEIVGSGVAVFDYDRDGDYDVYAVQGQLLSEGAEALRPTPSEADRRDQLWRNDFSQNGKLTFTNVTQSSGIRSDGFGMGVAVADVNGDGYEDLFVTNLGPNQLWLNRGDGRFELSEQEPWAKSRDWSTSASFFDFNRDGHPDLYITNYVVFDIRNSPKCYAPNSAQDYCGPDAYPAAMDTLLINRGDGSFRNASNLLGELRGAGLGVKAADLDGNGWTDIFVANDGDSNFLLLNQGGQRLADEGMLSGVAVNGLGVAEASMGIAMGDFDRDGDDDLFLTHLDGETNTLYENMGDLLFEDRTQQLGLGIPARNMTGFGTAWIDLDGDGWLDLVNANGAVRIIYEQLERGIVTPLQQPNQIFLNQAGKRFKEASAIAGPAFTMPLVSRGVAAADLDNDGDMDFLVSNNHGPLQFFLNQSTRKGSWLGLRLQDSAGHWQQGAQVRLKQPSQQPMVMTTYRDGSYLSSQDPRVVVSPSTPNAKFEVTWPDGSTEWFNVKQQDAYVDVVKGKGRPSP